jgi:hypothetical protein
MEFNLEAPLTHGLPTIVQHLPFGRSMFLILNDG